MYVIGLDIGGANVKAADVDSRARSLPFAVWKAPDRLSDALAQVLASFPSPEAIAVTMTAELTDCFLTKAEGVDAVLRAVLLAAPNVPIHVWQTGAEFVSPETARDIPLLVAAANWHALATWVGRLAPQAAALLIDVGSTTTDVIPILHGTPVPNGFTDRERLQTGELAYCGVRRTPLAALAHKVPFRGGNCPMAAELFATTLDVFLLLGDLPDEPLDCDTANGRPATAEFAVDRLARMLCSDRTEFSRDDALGVSRYLAQVQTERLMQAINQVLDDLDTVCESILVSGAGEFLARRVVAASPRTRRANVISLNAAYSSGIAESACAFAVARLAAERLPGI